MRTLLSRFDARLRRDNRLLLRLVVLLVIGYAAVAAFVFLLPTADVDVWFTRNLQRYQAAWLDSFMVFVSWFATITGGAITVGVTAGTFLMFRHRVEAGFVLLPLLVVPIVSVVKQLFGRARPTADVVRVFRQFNHESFPSGHVVFYVVFFGFLAFLMYRLTHVNLWIRRLVGWSSVALILLVPLSRMYLGAHWLTDVSAGFLLGLLLLIGLAGAYSRVKRGRLVAGQGD